MPRITARVGGSSSSAPTMSVTEPRRQQERAAEDHQHAVEHLARGHPALGERRLEAPPRRAALRLISKLPRIESAISSAIVHSAPIAWPTWMIT